MLPDDSTDLISRSIQHPNPLFDFLTTFVPRKLKTLFQYCEYLYYNSPQIFAALNKFAVYPVTDIIYQTDNPNLKTKYRKLLEETLHLKNVLVRTGIDRHVYGNSFASIYFPFRRFLTCPVCGASQNIRFVDYKFRISSKKAEFKFNCPKCKKMVVAKVEDRKLRLPSAINIIRWDPKHIEIEYNPITGESQYYYAIPPELQERIRKGDRHLLNTMPLPFIQTIAQRKIFKFAPGKIYHMKADAPSGIDNRWGFPPLTSTLKQFYYVAVLRKANEAISLEYVVPFRVLHPQQSTAAADPTITISLSNWVNEMKMNLKNWRKDPLHIMFSPIPVGVTQIGGQGRALMVTGEITEAENSIIAAMGIPREFIYGGLTATGGGITLRMLENQLLNHTIALIDEAQWISDQCGKFMGWAPIRLDLEDFKLVDDVQQKMTLLQANATTGGVLFSNTSLANMFGRDLKEERELRLQEMLDEQRFQADFQRRSQEESQNLADQARNATSAGQTQTYDQQQIIGQANQIAQQLSQMDPGMRQSQMHELQAEDAVMYACVVQAMEQVRTSQEMQAKQMMAQQQMGAPQGAPQGAPPGGPPA